MKEVAIGDLHGLDVWKKIVADNPDADMYVFIADYFDSFYISAEKQLKNFKEILTFKRKNKDRVKLLIGNHEEHYLSSNDRRYAGFQKFQHLIYGELLEKAIKQGLMQMCYLSGNILYTHAGVTKTWCKNNNIDLDNIEQSINDQFKYKPNSFLPIRGGDSEGNDIDQSPTWVRPQSLMGDFVEGYVHVVGHTVKRNLIIYDDVAFIDCLGESGEYLIVNDGKMSASEDLSEKISIEKLVRFLETMTK